MFKLLSLATTAIALLYAAEFTGIVPERTYFPTLPRLEKAENTPQNWAKAAEWGLGNVPSALTQLKLSLPETPTSHHGKFTDRVAAKNKPNA